MLPRATFELRSIQRKHPQPRKQLGIEGGQSRMPHSAKPGEAGQPRVVVVGAGFGGLAVARGLARSPVDVLVVDRENYHAFLPLLYQVATSGLSAQDISYPVRSILRQMPNARFQMAEITGGDLAERYLETGNGERIAYDMLVLAAGSTTEFFGNDSIERHAFCMHHLQEALELRNHVLESLERADACTSPERQALLGFVVVGGGPTGVELAGMLGEMRRRVVPRDFPELADTMRVTLLEGRDRLLAGFSADLSARALSQIRELGVQVRLGALVDRVSPECVTLQGGGRLEAHTVIWAAGVRGAPLGEIIGLTTDRAGRVAVEPTLEVKGHPGVWVVGDLARVRGLESLPQVAPVAMQQGQCLASNLDRGLRGDVPRPFRYRDRGAMATIGRNRAVARVFGREIAGRLAWWAWLLVHLVFLVGFRNRATVFLNWTYHYFTYDLGLRAIVGPRRRG
jgi:NADH dehydrogenase